LKHLKEVLAGSPVVPAVNQFELSPFLRRAPLVDFCREKGIQVESYSPLARGRKWGDPTLKAVAARHGKTPAQVLIRWALEKSYVVIPKSVRRERILENANVYDFAFTPEDMAALDGLNEDYFTIRPSFMEGEWE
jgi:diketogulonate reductase-like aldo/keto reductase